jgi:hypothetical protein
MEARNELETNIYGKKEWLEESDCATYCTEEELTALREKLATVSEWYDEDGWNANTTILTKNNDEVLNLSRPLENRVVKHKNRIVGIENFQQMMLAGKAKVKDILAEKPWTQKKYDEELEPEIKRIQEWFDERYNKQLEASKFEDPILTYEIIEQKIKHMKREVTKFNNTPKPKEEKVSNSTDTNSTDSNSTDGNSTNSEKKSKKKEKVDVKAERAKLEDLLKKMKEQNGGADNLDGMDKEGMEKMFVSQYFLIYFNQFFLLIG